VGNVVGTVGDGGVPPLAVLPTVAGERTIVSMGADVTAGPDE